jgi:hypothetical protein
MFQLFMSPLQETINEIENTYQLPQIKWREVKLSLYRPEETLRGPAG